MPVFKTELKHIENKELNIGLVATATCFLKTTVVSTVIMTESFVWCLAYSR